MQTSRQLGCSPDAPAVRASWEQLEEWWRQVACWAGAWKGVLWEVLGLVSVFQLSMGRKHCKKQTCKKRSPSFLSPSVPAFEWYLWVNGWGIQAVFETSGSVGVLLWEAMETVTFLQRLRQGVFCSAVHFHVQSWASSPPKWFIVPMFFWKQWPFPLRKVPTLFSPFMRVQNPHLSNSGAQCSSSAPPGITSGVLVRGDTSPLPQSWLSLESLQPAPWQMLLPSLGRWHSGLVRMMAKSRPWGTRSGSPACHPHPGNSRLYELFCWYSVPWEFTSVLKLRQMKSSALPKWCKRFEIQ